MKRDKHQRGKKRKDGRKDRKRGLRDKKSRHKSKWSGLYYFESAYIYIVCLCNDPIPHLGFLRLTNSFFPFLFRSSESSSGTDSGSTSSSRRSSDDEKASHHVSAHKTSNSTHTESKHPQNLGMPSVAFAHCDTARL